MGSTKMESKVGESVKGIQESGKRIQEAMERMDRRFDALEEFMLEVRSFMSKKAKGEATETNTSSPGVTVKESWLVIKQKKRDEDLQVKNGERAAVRRSEEPKTDDMKKEKLMEEKSLVKTKKDMTVGLGAKGPKDLSLLIRLDQITEARNWALKEARWASYTTNFKPIRKPQNLAQYAAPMAVHSTPLKTGQPNSTTPKAENTASKSKSDPSQPRRTSSFTQNSHADFPAKLNREFCLRCDEEYRSKHRWRSKQLRLLLMDDEEEEKSEMSYELGELVKLKKTKKNRKPKVDDTENGEEEEEHPNAVTRFQISELMREKLKSKGIGFAQRKDYGCREKDEWLSTAISGSEEKCMNGVFITGDKDEEVAEWREEAAVLNCFNGSDRGGMQNGQNQRTSACRLKFTEELLQCLPTQMESSQEDG